MPQIAHKEEFSQYLEENFGKLTQKKIAENLGVSVDTVKKFYYEKNLRQFERIPWTKEEEDYLKCRYRLIGNPDIAKEMTTKFERNFSIIMVKRKMRQMKLRRSVQEVSKITEKHLSTISSRVSTNESKVGSITTVYSKSKDRYIKFIKIAVGKKAVLYHRYIWEQANGTIPSGFAICFKDGNTLNCQIDNLVMKSQSELIGDNRDYEKRSKTDCNKAKDGFDKAREIYEVLKKKKKYFEKVKERWDDLNSGKYLIDKLKTNEYYEVKAELYAKKKEINDLQFSAISIIPVGSKFVNKKAVESLYTKLKNI